MTRQLQQVEVAERVAQVLELLFEHHVETHERWRSSVFENLDRFGQVGDRKLVDATGESVGVAAPSYFMYSAALTAASPIFLRNSVVIKGEGVSSVNF